jgi:dihydrofolate synthase/folylpolyglutamate synthase
MTYADTIDYLYSLRLFGTKLGLANTLKLAGMAGNPQEKLRFIHVAGTNGKGSTCAMLESIYRATGLRTGLFTSPHLVEFGERIQVNRKNIPEAEIVRQVTELKPLLARFPPESHPTFFEVVTLMALRYFAEKKCDLVIWETGLGGRLDATNIVAPLASVITNIQYDHENWLGSSLASIAAEKAGIIKPGVPVITATEEPEALDIIRETAGAKNAPLTIIKAGDLAPDLLQGAPALEVLNSIDLPLLGQHQRLNAALAVATVQLLRVVISVPEECLRRGLSEIDWPGRLQLVTEPSGRTILLDGAHNAAGAQVLAGSLEEYFAREPFTLILGILADKNWQQICRVLAPLARRILVVPVDSDRTALTGELAETCRASNGNAVVLQCANVREALRHAASDKFVVVSGSLYLVGEALECLQTASPGKKEERRLNEWQPLLNKEI